MTAVLTLDALPFYVGHFDAPENPAGMPSVLPFTLALDADLGHLFQQGSKVLDALLSRVYDIGSTVGNAMDDTDLGRRYAEDFLAFVRAHLRPGADTLEIGAGRGYLMRRLLDAGYRMTAVEPGRNNQAYWDRFGVAPIQALFPTPAAPGPFAGIVSYGVLEHILQAEAFLADIKAHLAPGGVVVLAVPDCADTIQAGDPSMLLHEHFHYFTAGSLSRLLGRAGLAVREIAPAGHGHVLYVAAVAAPEPVVAAPAPRELDLLSSYGDRVALFRRAVASRLGDLTEAGRSLGVFCPGRATAVLPAEASFRFFDDAPDLAGRYLPPFTVPVEDRAALLADPPDELWIMSWTFGQRLADDLAPLLPATTILRVNDLIGPELFIPG